MNIFEKYVSNTLASNGNQSFVLRRNADEPSTGLVFLKVYKGGGFNWIFGWSDVIDSTFADGSKSRCNDVYPWKIVSLEAAATDNCDPYAASKEKFLPITFGGKAEKKIEGEKITFSDPVKILAEKDKFICLRIKFSGRKVPCHPESQIALFRKKGFAWKASSEIPLPVFSGVERKAEKRIAFIGDSITQCIGTTFNSYRHYAAVIAEELGDRYGFWDMGIGFARGADAATDGIWLSKAKQNDIVTVCFDVNDIFKGFSAEEIKANLMKTVLLLIEANAKVIIQSIPPFGYEGETLKIWLDVNEYIKNEIAPKADAYFDTVKILSINGKDSPEPKYGYHPNDEGNYLWAKELAPLIKNLI